MRTARFTALFDAHYGRILGYARRRAALEDADDVVAETFAIAWRRLDEVPDGDAALYWLYATARRVVANQRRADRRRANLAGALEQASPRFAAAAEAPPDVVAALARLSARERELLLLVAWEELDARGIAAVLGCSRNAARIRIHRARRRFARALAEEQPPDRIPAVVGLEEPQ